MLPDIQNLMELQKAEREIQRLREEVAALPRRVAAIEEKLAGTKAQLEKAKAAVKADEAARRKYETAIQDQQQKISKYRDQSLAVKTNEQYKALLHEIQFAEQEIRAHEDRILETMVDAESKEKEVKAAEIELKEEAAEIEKEKAEAQQRTAEDEKLLAEWAGKRDQLRASVPADLLRHYERVSKFRGAGLSEVRDHKCMACQVMLRPQTYNEVRSGQSVMICESCQRILYFDATTHAPVERALAVRRRKPKSDAGQAWYYHPQHGEDGEVFLVFLNGPDNCSRRVYDLHTGRKVAGTEARAGEYRAAFAADLEGALRLNGSWTEAELQEWDAELPMIVLDPLQRDLEAARAESAAESESAETVPSQHPAAS